VRFVKAEIYFVTRFFFHEEFFVREKIQKFVLQNFNAFCKGGNLFCHAIFLKSVALYSEKKIIESLR
jgi:hypothetical protein